MYRFICIESKDDMSAYETTIISLFSEFIDFDHIDVTDHHLWMYYQHDVDVSLKDIILNLSQDTLVDFRLYQSYKHETKKSLEEHKSFISEKLNQISFNTYAFLDNQMIVKHFINELDHSFKYHMLKTYNQNQMMIQTVKIYLESNQNMSVAAKALYVHRNTLIQRIDKFYQVTGFDVKTFKDGFLIYHLLLVK